MIKFKSLKVKFIFIFMVLGLVPAIVISIISTINNTSDVSDKVYNQLTAINQIKMGAIENYFAERQGDVAVLIDIVDSMQQQAFKRLSIVNELKKSQLKVYFEHNKTQLDILANNATTRFAINELTENLSNQQQSTLLLNKYDTDYRSLLSSNGWADFFIINIDGTIVYSASRKSDLGLTISEDLKDSSLGHALTLARQSDLSDVQFGDFSPYAPNNNDPAAFFIKPVMENGQRIGYVAFQQALDKINDILGGRKLSESYLVGPDNLMRSDSSLNPTSYSLVSSFAQNNQVNTPAVGSALSGNKNTKSILNYDNKRVVSSWDYIDISDEVRWAIVSEVAFKETLAVKTSNNTDFYKLYIEKYGYYDLFLIDSDGHIFYSVNKEPDFNTNILNGKYADSNLGQLIKKVGNSNEYGMVDFAAYEPNNGAPAAFIAQPLLTTDGKVSLYVALQLPMKGIQRIMKIRAGMGHTGESYLVGDDLKMRSDSLLSPIDHSVKASFSGTISQNGVDTEATRRALKGEKGTDIIIDYNGNSVLSSYNRIDFDGFSWVIISEIDESEAFASIRSNTIFMLALMLAITIAISLIGLYVGGRMAKPIIEIAHAAQEVAQGNLTVTVVKSSDDEVGDLQDAIAKMIIYLTKMTSNISGIAIMQAATSEELAAITTETSATVTEQQAISEHLSTAMQEMGTVVNEVAVSTTTTSTAVSKIKNRISDSSSKLDETYSSIIKMTEHIEQSEQSVQTLRSEFEQVVNILNVIKGIADQTNLLALNAAIEAARAGEQGRGFAVVADEVRQLAQRTQDSTKEIDNVINTIMVGANSSVEVMAQSVKQANNVQVNAREVLELNRIVSDDVNEISSLSEQIATAAEEQSVVVDEILQQVETLNVGIIETQQATGNIAESSSELARLATELEKEASAFRT